MHRKKAPRRHRALRFEVFEVRSLMAADVGFSFGHNFISPEDANADDSVTPLDALCIINALNTQASQSSDDLDVNADGAVSPMDALLVINHLNTPGKSTSGVPAEARIARIEAALASGQLPTNISADEAATILTTLRLGGAPEMGDCTKIDDGQTNADKLAALSTQLADLGVAADTIDTVVTSIQTELDAGATDFRSVAKAVLDANGIDLKQLMMNQREQEHIDQVTAKLTAAGVDQTKVDDITSQMTDALKAGTPLTPNQLITALKALDIDPTIVFPTPKTENHSSHGSETVTVEDATEKLTELGVDADTIQTVVDKINEADAAGTPMTRRQLFALLQELGVAVKDPMGSRHTVGRGRGGR